MTLQNKNETVALSAKDKISKGHNNNELSRTDNIANNASNVNNNETKFSRDVDEFDERNYNVINTIGLRDYASLKHEVMTWDNIKHLNQVHCISIDDRFYLYKMLDNETKDIIIYKAKKRTRSEYNAIRRAYGRGIAKNDNNDNLSEEKYSRDVEYTEYLELKRENKHTNEVQSIDVLYAVNAKKEVAALDEPEFRPINGTALTTSTISIFNLLDYVNNCFPDILPEERKISVSSFLICLIVQAIIFITVPRLRKRMQML